MNAQSQDTFRDFLLEKIESFSSQQRKYFQRLLEGEHTARNINEEFDEQLTFGQRLADRVASFGGSWTFIILFGIALLIWISVNSFILAPRNAAFDPFPYILLNLFLSMLAAIQAPLILMSQNRQAVKDRLNAAHDYEVNLKAEMEIEILQQELGELRAEQWEGLVKMQQEQIRLLTQLLGESSKK